FSRDWSSDVCSSDLDLLLQAARPQHRERHQRDRQRLLQGGLPRAADGVRGGSTEAAGSEPRRKRRIAIRETGNWRGKTSLPFPRSEERRVGKEYRAV